MPPPTREPVVARTLGRLIIVPIGFLLGVTAAIATLLTLGLERVTQAVHGREIDSAAMAQVWDVLSDAHALASVATIMPAIILVIVGEVARIRSALFYMAGGGLAVAALPLLKRSAGIEQIGLVWQVFATAGFVGGVVYWLIAGRRA